MYETILTARHGDVLELTLNVPERLNAASLAMADELVAALNNLGDARAVLITGAGRAFCSGADLTSLGDSGGTRGEASYYALMNHYNPLMLKLTTLAVPVVAAVNGPAAGIGCSIALTADFVVVGTSGYFLQAFVNIGLIPDGGSTWMLPRLIGRARATEMMMLGEKVFGEKAESWGLACKCVADDMLLDEARTLAARLAASPTVALGTMRRLVASGLDGDFATALALEADGQRIAGDSEDALEGGLAFLQKRKPSFKGR